jgi:hypothetical protein
VNAVKHFYMCTLRIFPSKTSQKYYFTNVEMRFKLKCELSNVFLYVVFTSLVLFTCQAELCQHMLHLTSFHFSYTKHQCHLHSYSSHKNDTSYFSSNRSCHCESAFAIATALKPGRKLSNYANDFVPCVNKGCEMKAMTSERSREQHDFWP